MAIPEDQLGIWAKQGAVTGSKNTYASMNRGLEDDNPPLGYLVTPETDFR